MGGQRQCRRVDAPFRRAALRSPGAIRFVGAARGLPLQLSVAGSAVVRSRGGHLNETTRAVIVATAIAVAVLAILASSGVDISATRYVRLDAAVRDAFPEDELPETRFGDPSSFLLWAPAEQFLWDSLRSGKLPLWDR